MGRFSFLISRRWLIFLACVVLLTLGTIWLGNWQFDRLADRKERNNIIRANEQRHADPVAEVLTPGGTVDKNDQWRLVTATGTYAAEDTITWRYRTYLKTETPGAEVVVPLITADGTALMVNRGFIANDGGVGQAGKIPDAPTGTVTVEGYVREDGTGGATKIGADLTTRALSSQVAGEVLELETFGGWIQLKSEDPAPADAPLIAGLPELDEGPHFFYGIQWWFFGLIAVFGFGYLVWDEFKVTTAKSAPAGAGPGDETSVDPEADPEAAAVAPGTPISAKAAAKQAKVARQKAVKAAYRAAYEKEKPRT